VQYFCRWNLFFPNFIPQSGVGTTCFRHVVIKIRQLFLRSACLRSVLETGVGVNDCKCSRNQQLDMPSEARRSWRFFPPMIHLYEHCLASMFARRAHWPLGYRASADGLPITTCYICSNPTGDVTVGKARSLQYCSSFLLLSDRSLFLAEIPPKQRRDERNIFNQ
jgi:hypothetical protein